MPTRCRETDAYLAQIAEFNRPGHVFRIDENREIIFMEDEIVEHKLGRKLRDGEEVRHKNGNPLDNREENLELYIPVRGIAS